MEWLLNYFLLCVLLLSDVRQLVVAQDVPGQVNPASWMNDMRDIIGDRPLYSVVMPGAHDAGTYAITPESPVAASAVNWLNDLANIPVVSAAARTIASEWSIAQPLPIGKQLASGARYFDLRITIGATATPAVKPIGDDIAHDIWLFHGFLSYRIVDAIDEIANFVNNYPNEILILDFNNDAGMTTAHCNALALHLSETFAGKLAPFSIGRNVSLEQMLSAGHQIIVVGSNPQEFGSPEWLWPRSRSLWSPWANTEKLGILREKLDFYSQTHPTDRFFVLQGIRTENRRVIEDGIFFKPHNLHQFAQGTNPSVLSWAKEWQNRTLNIIMLDFFNEFPVLELCIQLNFVQNAGIPASAIK